MIQIELDDIPADFISDYLNHKATPYGKMVILDLIREWLNHKYGLGSIKEEE